MKLLAMGTLGDMEAKGVDVTFDEVTANSRSANALTEFVEKKWAPATIGGYSCDFNFVI